MTKRIPTGAGQHTTAGPYSPVLEVSAGELVVISGQGPLDEAGALIGQTIEEQTEATLRNCREQLATAGVDFSHVFRVNVYLSDLDEWARFNVIYGREMPEPRPVRTAVGVQLLLGMKVEIDMWAARP